MTADAQETLAISAEEIDNTIQRIAFEILEKHGSEPLLFVGIHTRGVTLADRVAAVVRERNPKLRRGTIDITLYRDDLDNLGTIPSVRDTELPMDLDGARIILFDDVLFTGRTIRAAINVIMDYGRPALIELAVLVDRGRRELPICPTWSGRRIETGPGEYISVRFRDDDGDEGVYLLRPEADGEEGDA